MKNQIFLLIILLLITNYTKAQIVPENNELSKIRNEVQQSVNAGKIPSMAIAVVKDGKIVWQEAIGYADVEKKQKANINSVYPLGSVSKSITATGIIQMVNSGKLDLMQDINPLLAPIELKNFDGKSPPIKLWQLVSMNGGINHAYGVFYDAKNLPLAKDARKRFFEATTIVAFQPGEVYEYANNAFYLAEIIIEKVSQKDFQGYLNENVFQPLGMKNTFAYFYKSQKQADFVTTYSTKLEKINRNLDYPGGGSGFWSSLDDMTKYAMFHLGVTKNSNVINEENLKKMHDFRQGSADLFGIGWFNSGGNLYSNGNVDGGNASISIDKKNNLAIICLLNQTSWNGLADEISGKIKKVFVSEESGGFKQWQRIYGTPFSSRLELLGKWKGFIKQPVSNFSVPLEIHFDESNKISLLIDSKKLELANPTFNLLKELEGSFRSNLPKIYEKETRCGLKLKLNGDKLSGYLAYDSFTEEKFYRMPLFVELEKEK